MAYQSFMPLWVRIVLCVGVIEALGISSGLITASSIPNWYASLEKPPGTPPNWIFGPVWTVLYAMMGISFALVWHRAAAGADCAVGMRWFAGQLILNLAWTPLFFGAHLIGWALVVIIALLVAIGLTVWSFRRVDSIAALLLVPYLCWVGYASYLNAGHLVLNR